MTNTEILIELLKDVKIYNQHLADKLTDSDDQQDIVIRAAAQKASRVADAALDAIHGSPLGLRHLGGR